MVEIHASKQGSFNRKFITREINIKNSCNFTKNLPITFILNNKIFIISPIQWFNVIHTSSEFSHHTKGQFTSIIHNA